MVVTNGAESLKTPPLDHVHPPHKDMVKYLMKWYLITNIPLNSNLSFYDFATNGLSNMNYSQQSMVHTCHQLTRFITNKRRDDTITDNNPETAKDIVISSIQVC